ncbi:MAG: outer membrane beta-barrel protein [Burkholderiales bacterium]
MKGGRLLLALCLGSLPAGAARAQAGTWYMGMSFGASTTEVSEGVVAVSGATASNIWRDVRDPGVKLILGHAFNRRLAVEGGFAHLGEFSITREVTAPAAGAVNASLRVKGFVIDLVGTLPLGGRFAALGKAGVLLSEVRTFRTVSGSATLAPGLGSSAIRDEINFKLGAGLQYELSPKATLRVEWERFYRVGDPVTTGELDINLVSGGLLLRF